MVVIIRFGMMSKGDEGSWSIMLERFQAEENAQEKSKLLYGLGKTDWTAVYQSLNHANALCRVIHLD